MVTLDFIKWSFRNLKKTEFQGKKVLDVGSLELEGSLRFIIESFKPKKYLGVDIKKGKGVDFICQAEDLVRVFGQESFAAVICSFTLEHILNWQKAISNIKNVCQKAGLIIIAVPVDHPYHGYPNDYWRFQKRDLQRIFSDCQILSLEENHQWPFLLFAKIKKPLNFKENNLSSVKLFSILLGRKVGKISKTELESFRVKKFLLKNKIKNYILNLGAKILYRL